MIDASRSFMGMNHIWSWRLEKRYILYKWDLVNIQRSDYGGGEIWFDKRLIRKNGQFVIPELKGKFTKKSLGG